MKTDHKIYIITNKINGRQYTGYTKNSIEERFDQHSQNTSQCQYIARAIQCYGAENFKIEQIFSFITEDKNTIGEIEDFFITYYNTLAPSGYNLKRGGINGKMCEIVKKYLHF
jgi:group I intron endonuclease